MGKCISKHDKRLNSKVEKITEVTIDEYAEVQRYLKNRSDIPQNYLHLKLDRRNLQSFVQKIKTIQRFLLCFRVSKLSLIDLDLKDFDFTPPTTLRTLDLSQNKLHILNPVVLKATNLKKLCLKQNVLEHIPNKIAKLKGLQTLILNENKITEFTKKPFIGLQIKSIHLSHNMIEELSVSLAQLPELVYLDLSYNKIKRVDEKFFGNGQNKLEFLSLRNNPHLDKLPDRIDYCQRLKILEVSSTSLKALPLSLGNLNELYHIELSQAKITKPPSYITAQGTFKIKEYLKVQIQKKKTKVESWDMFLDHAHHCQASKIVLKNLQFDISEDDPTIFELNSYLGNYISLNEIVIQNSMLPSIPFTLPKSLTTLILNDNLIKDVPKIVLKNSKIEKVDLSSNKIENFDIKSANFLSTLNLSNNLISSIHDLCFVKLPKLQFLNLSQNRIKSIGMRMNQLENLTVLNLSLNQLTIIPCCLFDTENLVLSTLLLNNNKLSEIPETIQNLKSLKYLDLHHNQITYLPKSLFKMESIEKVTLYKNNFNCSENELTRENMAQLSVLLTEKEKQPKYDDEDEQLSSRKEIDSKSTHKEDNSEKDIRKEIQTETQTEIEKAATENRNSENFFSNKNKIVFDRKKLVSVRERKKNTRINRLEKVNTSSNSACLLGNPAYANTLKIIDGQINVREYITDLFHEESNANDLLTCLQTIQSILLKVLPDDKMKPKAFQIPILSDYYEKRIVKYRAASKILKYVGFSLAVNSTQQTVLRIKFNHTLMDYMNPDILRKRVKTLKNSISAIVKTFRIDKDRDELRPDINFIHY